MLAITCRVQIVIRLVTFGHTPTLTLTIINELQYKKPYQIKISKKFRTLETISDNEDLNMAWEIIQQNIKISAKSIVGLYE